MRSFCAKLYILAVTPVNLSNDLPRRESGKLSKAPTGYKRVHQISVHFQPTTYYFSLPIYSAETVSLYRVFSFLIHIFASVLQNLLLVKVFFWTKSQELRAEN
jgi:hypothetical protein